MSSEIPLLEHRESAPAQKIVLVDFLRHGETTYIEDEVPKEQKAIMGEHIPRDLTVRGAEQVRATAQEIVARVDAEREIVVLWSSPAWRAQGSEDVLEEELAKQGIAVYRASRISSMRPFTQYDKSYMENFWKIAEARSQTPESVYGHDPEFQEPNDKFETQNEVRARAAAVFRRVSWLTERARLEGKQLHIIGVSHFEFINPIMEDIFDFSAKENAGVRKGEGLSLRFTFDPTKKIMHISADFRGVHKDNIVFDKKSKSFVIRNE